MGNYVIGLTGGIGSGKTTVANIFSTIGITIIDTDEIARGLTDSGGVAMPAIKKIFGEDFIASDGALNRDKIRRLVFSNDNCRQRLEKILHPLIFAEAVRSIKLANSTYVIIVIPLLFETGDYHEIVQHILVVDCEEQAQVTRTVNRSRLAIREVRAIMAAQISRQERLQKASDVILNNKNIDFLQRQVINLHRHFLELSARSAGKI